jgi:E-phenylitaconyl-CoA hydratase
MVLNYEKKGHIAIFTLNRPEQMNAKNMEMFRRLEETMIDFRDDPEMRVGIITGAGNKAFCAGADVKDALPFMQANRNKEEAVGRNIIYGLDVWKPFIAAVNGVAYGGGCELALACDLRIASENARFAQAEIWVGAMPGCGGTQRLTRMIPRCKAAEMLLMGRVMNAQEAYRIGLVNEVVPSDQLMTKAMEYAETICQWSPVAVKSIKQAMIQGSDMSLAEGMTLERLLFLQVINSRDFQEGTRAFAEKRKPEFKGE